MRVDQNLVFGAYSDEQGGGHIRIGSKARDRSVDPQPIGVRRASFAYSRRNSFVPKKPYGLTINIKSITTYAVTSVQAPPR